VFIYSPSSAVLDRNANDESNDTPDTCSKDMPRFLLSAICVPSSRDGDDEGDNVDWDSHDYEEREPCSVVSRVCTHIVRYVRCIRAIP
jgi:hypothetical protein